MLRRLFLITTLIFTLLIFTKNIKATDVYSDGRLDIEFAKAHGKGPNNTIRSIVETEEGKLMVSGYLSSYDGLNGSLFLLNNDGSVDRTFNSANSACTFIYTFAIQSDRKIIIVCGNKADNLRRLNIDGSLDMTFNPGGTGPLQIGGTSSPKVTSIVVQSDGKILIGGSFTSYNGVSRNRIARLNSDGSLDTGFNPGTGPNTGFVTKVAILPDNKIIIVGDFSSYNGTTIGRIARLNSDGSLDTTFNIGGAEANNSINHIIFQSDGKIIIGGYFTTYNGVGRNRIARLNSDGSLDTSFNPGTGANGSVNDIIIQTDGKILIGGSFTTYNGLSRNRIARLNSDGSSDVTFDPGTGADKRIQSVLMLSDGKIIIGGDFNLFDNDLSHNYLARINNDGSIDTSFRISEGEIGANTKLITLAVQDDGKAIVAGGCDFKYYDGVFIGGIARINIDGSLDESFNAQGTGVNDAIYSIEVQSDGKILIGGRLTSYNGVARNSIARINSDGSLDTTFDPGTGANSDIYSMALQSDGKIIIGGYFTTYNGVSRNKIARLNIDGSLDTSFNPGTGANGTVYTSAIYPDGKIVIAGGFTTYNGAGRIRVARLNSDGSLDTTFDPGTGANNTIRSVGLQSDGKIIILGYFSTFNGVGINSIARLNKNGSFDESFNYGGSGLTSSIIRLVGLVQEDDKILFTYPGMSCNPLYNGVEVKRLNRLNSDGTIDTGFNAGGSGPNSKVKDVEVADDGSIYIVGRFQSYNDTKVAYLAKLGLPDVEAPTGSISINSDALYTTNSNVSLTLNAIDTYSGLKEMMVCNNSSFTGCDWENYTGSKSWVLDSNLGTKTVYVKYNDNEDNVSEVYSDSIELYNLVVRITDIGLIDDVPDRESLFYYFTSQRVVIRGETKSNSTVYFTYDNETYTTTSDVEGEYSITLWVDMGTNSISYHAEDESGNESPTRTLTLVVGTEYFPNWLLIKIGLLPTEDEEMEEEIEEEEEEIVIPEIEEETKTAIQIIGFDGDPLRDTEVVFDDVSYISDGEGYIYLIDVEEGSHIVKLKINEEEYSQLLVLGEDDLESGSIVRFEYKADYTMYVIVGCLSLILMTIVSMIIYKRRGINKGIG